MVRRCVLGPLLWALLLSSAPAWSSPLGHLFILGDSLSDSGNAAVLTTDRATPPFHSLMTTAPYPGGRFSNGPVWAERLAAELDLSNAASLRGGTNFAFGGARTGPLPGLPPSVSPTLHDQAQMLLASPWSHGGRLPADSLVVVQMSATVYQTAAMAAALTAAGVDPTVVSARVDAVLEAAVVNLSDLVAALSAAGTSELLVLNTPDLGLTPQAREAALASEATFLSASFNDLLAAELALLSATLPVNVRTFDLFRLLRTIVAMPTRFGLSNVTDPCIRVGSVVDAFCADPSSYLFWDGIHPTAAGHAVLANALKHALIPAPGTLLLLGIGVLGFGLRSRHIELAGKRPARGLK